jgi:hypothetical protein
LQAEEFATPQTGCNREHDHQPGIRLQLSQDSLNFLWFEYYGIHSTLRTLPHKSDGVHTLVEPFTTDCMVEQDAHDVADFRFG